MIYLFYGTSDKLARDKWRATLDSLAVKQPEATVARLDAENFSLGQLEELIGGQALFYNKCLVAGDHLLSQTQEDGILESIPAMAASQNVFLLLEGELNKDLARTLKGQMAREYRFDKPGEKIKEAFNVFLLTDALGRRDKKELWVLFQRALRRGLSAEEVYWKFVWQVKNLLLCKKTAKPEDFGWKPFRLTKTRSLAGNFTVQELEERSAELVNIYARCRLGEGEMAPELEKLIFGL